MPATGAYRPHAPSVSIGWVGEGVGRINRAIMAPPPRGESYEADHKSIVCHKEAVLLNTWVSQLSPGIFFSAADWPGDVCGKEEQGDFF